MTGQELIDMTHDLETFYGEFGPSLGRSETRDHALLFARGQLGPIERKSLEPIADAEGIEPRRLQFFFSKNAWDQNGARDHLQHIIARKHGGDDGIFIIDETSDAKKGEWTAGVARQYCGESGKIDNCIVSVHLGYAREDFHALLDGELFLPGCWNPNPDDLQVTLRRKRAKLPEDAKHETKTVMALRQLARAVKNGVPGRYVTADELYGGAPWWRRAIDDMEMVYVVEVPCNVYGWIGRKAGQARRLDEMAASDRSLRSGRKKYYRTHETTKGPEVWACRKVDFFEQADNAPDKVQQLLVATNVRTGEVKYFLSNGSRKMKTEQLLRVAFSRWRIERCFQDCKSELGLNHAEIRTYKGLHRHFILTAMNYYFLQQWVMAHKPGGKRLDAIAMRRRGAGCAGAKSRRHHDRRTVTGCGRRLGRAHTTNPIAQPQSAHFCTKTALATIC